MAESKSFQDNAMTVDDIARVYGWSKTTQWRQRQTGNFPPGYMIGKLNFWRKSTIESWIAEQEAKGVTNGGNDDAA